MAVYDKNGNPLTAVYDKSGTVLLQAYDKNGNPLIEEEPYVPVTPLSWDMSETYQTQVLSALNYIEAYKQNHSDSYSICQFNDTHTAFSGNEPNFVDYNRSRECINYMLFLGDLVNSASASSYADAVSWMQGAQACKRLVGMGNHEYYYYNSSTHGNPETLYKAVINTSAKFMPNESDALIYYHDDPSINVRFILLDYFYITKSPYDDKHLLDDAQLNWLASVLETSGNKDIIIGAHSMLSPFLCLESQQTKSSTATLTNYQNLIDVIVAFKQRSTYSVTVDGVTHNYDFSSCTGDFVMYTTGHYHALGYGDFGFNMFTCPTFGTTYGGSHKGFVFYVIDKALKAIKVIQCSSQLTDYISFDYTY